MEDKKVIYLIGSLKNEKIPYVAKELRELGFEVFDDWFSPGPEADDFWRKYEKVRGSTYKQALKNYAGKHIFEFDSYHVERADIGVLLMPAGKSGHLELGVMIGQKKPCFILFDKEPERWDVMYQFAKEVCFSKEELFDELKNYLNTNKPIITDNPTFPYEFSDVYQPFNVTVSSNSFYSNVNEPVCIGDKARWVYQYMETQSPNKPMPDGFEKKLVLIKWTDELERFEQHQKIVNDLNYHNECAKATIGEVPKITVDDLKYGCEISGIFKHYD